MNPRDVLEVADDLAEGNREAEWRSAISRAYYAAFLVARELFERVGFVVPQDAGGHAYVWLRLSNCGRQEVVTAAQTLSDLRRERGYADYDLRREIRHRVTRELVSDASDVIRVLDELADSEAVLAQVVEAMRVYERDVRGEATFRGPEASE